MIIFVVATFFSGCASTYIYNGDAHRCDGSPAYGDEVLGIDAEWMILPFPIVAGIAKIDEHGNFTITTDRRIHYFVYSDQDLNFNVKNKPKLSYNSCR